MDGLNYDMSEYEVGAASDDEALVLHRQINDFIPIQEDGYKDTFLMEALANPNSSPHSVPLGHPSSAHASGEPLSSSHSPGGPLSSTHAPGEPLSSVPPHQGELRGDVPQAGDKLICFEENEGDNNGASYDDDVVCIGGKRPGDGLVTSSAKHQRTYASTSPLFGFLPYAGATSGFSGALELELANPSVGPSTSPPCPGVTTHTLTYDLPSARSVGLHSGFIVDGHLHPLSQDFLTYLTEVGKAKFDGESSQMKQPPFMSARAGSGQVPGVVADFNKGVGNHVYVPRSVIRLKDDGREPTQARNLIDAMVAPMLIAESGHKTLDELVDSYDLHAYLAALSGSILRKRLVEETRELTQLVEQLQGNLASSHDGLKLLGEKLDKEVAVSALLREENKRVVDECLSLKGDIDVLNKEK